MTLSTVKPISGLKKSAESLVVSTTAIIPSNNFTNSLNRAHPPKQLSRGNAFAPRLIVKERIEKSPHAVKSA